jgi:hypothetical protein
VDEPATRRRLAGLPSPHTKQSKYISSLGLVNAHPLAPIFDLDRLPSFPPEAHFFVHFCALSKISAHFLFRFARYLIGQTWTAVPLPRLPAEGGES